MIKQDRIIARSIATCFSCTMGYALLVYLAMRSANALSFVGLLLSSVVLGAIFCVALLMCSCKTQQLYDRHSIRLAIKCIMYQISFGALGFFVGAFLGSASSVPFVVFLFVLISGFVLAVVLPIIYCPTPTELLNEPIRWSIAP